MRVAIVENTRVTHHGQVGVALHEAGALIDQYKPWSGQPLPRSVDADALVVFGGEQAATDDHTHPYLPALARLMADY
ncbi:MAG: GMP synthase, partial [Pseudomonadota bacterium]